MVDKDWDDPTIEDDLTIGDDTELLRRIPPWHFTSDGKGGVRPSSAAFENDRDGDPMSIAITDELERLNLNYESVLSGHEGFGLVGFKAGTARTHKVKQKIVRNPLPKEPAHGLVIGKKTSSVRKNFSKRCRWIGQPPSKI